MEYSIRTYKRADVPFLWEMLYESIHIPEDQKPDIKVLLQEPDIERYLKDWGQDGDHAFIATNDQDYPIGAIWMRRFSKEHAGYGFIDENTPEIGMAICPEYRGNGIGKSLLNNISCFASSIGYRALSLSVDPRNVIAVRLYEKSGFVKVVEDDGGSWVMKKEIWDNQHYYPKTPLGK